MSRPKKNYKSKEVQPELPLDPEQPVSESIPHQEESDLIHQVLSKLHKFSKGEK